MKATALLVAATSAAESIVIESDHANPSNFSPTHLGATEAPAATDDNTNKLHALGAWKDETTCAKADVEKF